MSDSPQSPPFPPGARVGLVWNPAAGRRKSRRRLGRLREAFRRAGIEVVETPTASPGHAEEIARRHAEAGAAAVFCWGGDGTLAETARGLLNRVTALAPLPGGTVNVLAAELGVPGEEASAVAALLSGRLLRVRPGLVRRIEPPTDLGSPGRPAREAAPPETGARLFLSICSVGLDALAARRVGARRRRRGGLRPWVVEGARVFLGERPPDLRVRLSPAGGAAGRSEPLPAAWVGVGMQSRYTRWLRLFPDSRLEDPDLGVTLVSRLSRLAVPLVAAAAAAGRLRRAPGVRVERASTVRIEIAGGPERGAACQTDGDPFPGGRLDAGGAFEITRSPDTLRLLVPAGYRPVPAAEPPG